MIDLKFVIVSGKGGVGRTTVAATLARVAAAAGKRVLVAESTTTDRLARMFGHSEPLPSKITTLAPGIDAVNVTPASSMQEYGVKILRSELVTRAVFENRAVRGLLSAIPGLDGYAILGKVWWHTTETVDGRPRYDLVIFDGPASGHAAPDVPHPAGDPERDADGAARARRAIDAGAVARPGAHGAGHRHAGRRSARA